MDKVFLMTTGSEATECAVKLSRAHGVASGGRSKSVIVTFDRAFHGRTLGAQLAGGTPKLKEWIITDGLPDEEGLLNGLALRDELQHALEQFDLADGGHDQNDGFFQAFPILNLQFSFLQSNRNH